jgi:hypothetical protein
MVIIHGKFTVKGAADVGVGGEVTIYGGGVVANGEQ